MSDDDVMDIARSWTRSEQSSRGAERSATPEMPEAELDEPHAGKYEAFKAVDREPACLSIYTHGNPANVYPSNQYFQYVADDGQGRLFDIVYGFFVVRVRGRNLLPVVRAVKSKRCAFIQLYQRREDWPEPGRDEPKIEKIEIVHQPSARAAILERGGTPA
jgi:hypothetical protein